MYQNREEKKWVINRVVAEDTAEDQERCIRRFAEIVRKNVKSLSSRAVTVRCTAGSAFQKEKMKVDRDIDPVGLFWEVSFSDPRQYSM